MITNDTLVVLRTPHLNANKEMLVNSKFSEHGERGELYLMAAEVHAFDRDEQSELC